MIFLHLHGPNDIYVELAQEASKAITDEEIKDIKQKIANYRDKSEFKAIDEALKNQPHF